MVYFLYIYINVYLHTISNTDITDTFLYIDLKFLILLSRKAMICIAIYMGGGGGGYGGCYFFQSCHLQY